MAQPASANNTQLHHFQRVAHPQLHAHEVLQNLRVHQCFSELLTGGGSGVGEIQLQSTLVHWLWSEFGGVVLGQVG